MTPFGEAPEAWKAGKLCYGFPPHGPYHAGEHTNSHR